MASEILGLFTSPEQYQQQQDLMMQRQAAELAQLDPYQSVRFGAIRAGQQFGRGLAGILGAEDPQLRMISTRQSALQGINLGDPESIFTAAQQLADAGDQQGALMLADYGRKAQADAALVAQRTRERMSPALQAAGRIRELTVGKQDLLDKGALPDSPEIKAIDVEIASLSRGGAGKPQTFGENREAKALELFDKPFADLSTGERKTVNDALEKPDKAAKAPTFGVDREAVAQEVYGKSFFDLTQTEKAAVNKRVDEESNRRAVSSAPKLTIPGEKGGPANIAQFRTDVIATIKPYRESVSAADKALAALENSIKENNFSSYDVARKQLLKAAGESQISNADVKTVGTDPSITGGTIDIISKAITSTPSIKTQNQLRDALRIVRKEAVQKARDELNVQRRIANRAGFKEDDIKLVFEFPEFEPKAPTDGKPAGGKVRKNWAELP